MLQPMNNRPGPQQSPLFTANILWIAFLMSIFVHAAVAFFLVPTPPAAEGPISTIILLASFGLIGLSKVIPKQLATATLKKLSAEELADERRFLQACFTPYIIQTALIEGVSVLAVVNTITLGNRNFSALQFALAVVFMVLTRPTKAAFESWIPNHGGAGSAGKITVIK